MNGAAAKAAGKAASPHARSTAAKRSTSTSTHWVGMRYLDEESGEPIVAAPYEIHRQGGAVLSGQLDAQGRAEHHNLDDKPVVKVIYKPRPPAQERPHPPLRG